MSVWLDRRSDDQHSCSARCPKWFASRILAMSVLGVTTACSERATNREGAAGVKHSEERQQAAAHGPPVQRPAEEDLWDHSRIANLSFPSLSPREEFRMVERRLRESTNRFHGRVSMARLVEAIESPKWSPADQCALHAELTMELLRIGDIDGAVDAIERAFRIAAENGVAGDILPRLHRARAIAYLRRAEQQNCLAAHCAQSCIFPIEGGGIHHQRDAAEQARRDYEAYLATDPPDKLESMWVLNILNMVLGEYPRGVPAQYLVPIDATASTADVGRFRDISSAAGVDRMGIAGGVIAEDFDNDGLLDLVASSADPSAPLSLYHNEGSGQFRNVATEANLHAQLGGLQCNWCDFNNDTRADILVLRGAWFYEQGRIRRSLLKNNGNGTFEDVTRAAGLADPAFPSQAAAWGDFDNDGHVDLYVANESLIERGREFNFPSQLFHNNGNGTFTDVATAAGVTNDRYAKGVAAGDYDNDGDLDIYVSNFHYFQDKPNYGRNRLYRNNGDGTFTDLAESLGVTEPLRSFAAWFFDYDNDGWLDLWVSAYQALLKDVVSDYLKLPHQDCRLRLYHNEAGKGFADVTRAMGLKGSYQAMGASFGDLDNDGYLDVYLGTGGQFYDWLVPNVMLRNDAGRRFQDVTTSGGFGHLQKGHGIAFADLDNDGDQDVYACLGGFYPGDQFRNSLFLNPGHGNHFLMLRLLGTKTNRAAVGARIKVLLETPARTREIHRAQGMVSSFGSHPWRHEIGLGDATRISRLEIEWPTTGSHQVLENVPMDRLLEITEGTSTWRELPPRRLDFDQHVRQEASSPETAAQSAR